VTRFLALVLLVVLGLTIAGCGSGKKQKSATTPIALPTSASSTVLVLTPGLTVTGTKTIPNVPTGMLVRCKGGASAKVPRRGAAVAAGRDKLVPVGSTAPSPPSREIEVMHLRDGSVTVTCKSTS